MWHLFNEFPFAPLMISICFCDIGAKIRKLSPSVACQPTFDDPRQHGRLSVTSSFHSLCLASLTLEAFSLETQVLDVYASPLPLTRTTARITPFSPWPLATLPPCRDSHFDQLPPPGSEYFRPCRRSAASGMPYAKVLDLIALSSVIE